MQPEPALAPTPTPSTATEAVLTGNNVRRAGIDVGTVRRIRILNDSTVRVSLNRGVRPFVKKNAVASIGTDGWCVTPL